MAIHNNNNIRRYKAIINSNNFRLIAATWRWNGNAAKYSSPTRRMAQAIAHCVRWRRLSSACASHNSGLHALSLQLLSLNRTKCVLAIRNDYPVSVKSPERLVLLLPVMLDSHRTLSPYVFVKVWANMTEGFCVELRTFFLLLNGVCKAFERLYYMEAYVKCAMLESRRFVFSFGVESELFTVRKIQKPSK